MSDSVGRSGGVDLDRPDASFHDDHVGARVKSEEAARIRQAAGRYIKPKFVETEAKQISGPGRFRPAHHEPSADALEREARRDLPNQPTQSATRRVPRGPQPAHHQALRQQERLEQRLALLLDTMVQLHGMLSAEGEEALADEEQEDKLAAKQKQWRQVWLESDDSDEQETSEDEQQPPDEQEASGLSREDRLVSRLARAEQAAKFAVQQLLAGNGTLTLMADPLLTFKRLFDRIGTWPPLVRPGHRPQTEAEVDMFLTWAFEPAGGWEELETFAAPPHP